jgi:hypothetical protein
MTDISWAREYRNQDNTLANNGEWNIRKSSSTNDGPSNIGCITYTGEIAGHELELAISWRRAPGWRETVSWCHPRPVQLSGQVFAAACRRRSSSPCTRTKRGAVSLVLSSFQNEGHAHQEAGDAAGGNQRDSSSKRACIYISSQEYRDEQHVLFQPRFTNIIEQPHNNAAPGLVLLLLGWRGCTIQPYSSHESFTDSGKEGWNVAGGRWQEQIHFQGRRKRKRNELCSDDAFAVRQVLCPNHPQAHDALRPHSNSMLRMQHGIPGSAPQADAAGLRIIR